MLIESVTMSDPADEGQVRAEAISVVVDFVQSVDENIRWKSRGKAEAIDETLVALRDALLRVMPVEDDDPVAGSVDSDANKVVAVLDDDLRPWVVASVPLSRWRRWDTFGFSPESAGEWERFGVPVEYAKFFHANHIGDDLWEQWIDVHDFKDDDIDVVIARMTHLVMRNMEDLSVGASVNKWVESGVSVWDAAKWFAAGYTPATAKTAMKKGMTVDQLTSRPVPGTMWPKVVKHVEMRDWVSIGVVPHSGNHQAQWERDDDILYVTFDPNGKIKSAFVGKEIGFASYMGWAVKSLRELDELLEKVDQRAGKTYT
jgi:hypothetical protein